MRRIKRFIICLFKLRRFKSAFLAILCGILIILLLMIDALKENRYIIISNRIKYLYVRPSGLLKELFPSESWVPYRLMSFDKEFLYPLDVNMTELAECHLRKEPINATVINGHPFRYIYNPKSLCSVKSTRYDIPLLILIKSSVLRHRLRHVIRKTWGKQLKIRATYKMAFLLGCLPSYQHLIDNEQYIYQDIIQEDFIDAYWNNTYKTIMAFNWASQYCSNARTVLFLDDDMFVNLDNLESYVSELDKNRNEDLFSGILAKKGTPTTDVMSKWFLPFHDYPYDYYPNYLAGSVIFASMSVVKRFQAVFPYIRYLGIDDVYLGIVAYKLHIVPTETPNLDNEHLRNFRNLSCLIANHGFDDPVLFLKTFTNLTSILP